MLARLLARPIAFPLRSLAVTLASSTSSLLQPPPAPTPAPTSPPRFSHPRPFSTDNRGGGEPPGGSWNLTPDADDADPLFPSDLPAIEPEIIGGEPPGGSWSLTPDADDADPLFPSAAADLPAIEPEIIGRGGGAGEEGNPWLQPEQEEKGDIFDDIVKGGGEVGGDEWETAEGDKPWSLGGGDEETGDLFDGIEVGGIDGVGDGAVDEERQRAEEEEKRELEMREKVLLKKLKGPERAFGDLIQMSGITEDMICSLILLKDVRNVPGLPPLSEIEQKAIDRQNFTSSRDDIERKKQEEIAQARVRKVDVKGRAYGTGRRKCSIARVWIQTGDGKFTVNEKPFDSYFPILDHRATLLDPFSLTNTLGLWDITSTVKGGGVSGQVGAIRLGICRALQNWEPGFRPYLKSAGYLTRDPRVVERKKPGKAKARKSFQWVKR